MTGTLIFKPIEAKFYDSKDFSSGIYPTCKIRTGWHSAEVVISKFMGKSLFWSDQIVLKRKHEEMTATIKVKSLSGLVFSKKLGKAKIDLGGALIRGKSSQWYNLYKRGRVVGEISLEIVYESDVEAERRGLKMI